MPESSLAPLSGLIANDDNNRFVLFGNQWLVLQSYIQQALALPINEGDWNDKYGQFSKQDLVTDALGVMKDVHDLSAHFGNPHIVKKRISEDGNYLFGKTPPDEIYGHIIWLAVQIQNAAGAIKNYLTPEKLDRLLNPDRTPDPQKRARYLTEILTGKGGVQSKADKMKNLTADLLQKMTSFDGQMNAANKDLLEYVGAESEILADANQTVGDLNAGIKDLQGKADEAMEQWRNYTIAAVASSVGVMIITGGLALPIAAGLGGGLGAAAAMAMDVYNDLMADIAKAEVEVAKKTRLVTDLTGFNSQVALVTPAMSSFIQTLEEVEGVWAKVGTNLAYIVNNYSADQLGDLGWFMQTFEIDYAIEKWEKISAVTEEFTQNSLVSFRFETQWGDRMAA